jgi:hypothetical protein
MYRFSAEMGCTVVTIKLARLKLPVLDMHMLKDSIAHDWNHTNKGELI